MHPVSDYTSQSSHTLPPSQSVDFLLSIPVHTHKHPLKETFTHSQFSIRSVCCLCLPLRSWFDLDNQISWFDLDFAPWFTCSALPSKASPVCQSSDLSLLLTIVPIVLDLLNCLPLKHLPAVASVSASIK